MFKKFLILLSFFVASCSTIASQESPVIYFSNASLDPIKNIHCEWADGNVLSLPLLNPGDSRSQSFYLKKSSAFFGLVKVSWISNAGENVSREFYFRENNLPSIDDHSTYNYVQIYFDQSDIEVVSSDAPDLSGKTRRMDALLLSYKNNYLHGHPVVVPTSLIRVEPIKDRSLPGWLNSAF